MPSNRHLLGVFSTISVPAQFAVCKFPFSNFHFPPFQIDTSRDLKSHLNHCKQSASSFSDRQPFGCISFRFISPRHHHPVDFDLAASNPPSRSSNLRSMLYSLYSEGAATLP